MRTHAYTYTYIYRHTHTHANRIGVTMRNRCVARCGFQEVGGSLKLCWACAFYVRGRYWRDLLFVLFVHNH